MSEASLKWLREGYPGRYGLSPEEVAHVLRGQSTRGVVQRIREGMKSGRYPGARKIDGHLQLPIEALAEILEPSPNPAPVVPTVDQTKPIGRRKSAIGPRIAFVRVSDFWEQVLRAIGEPGFADELAAASMQAIADLERDFAHSKAERERHELQGSTPLIK